MYHLQPYKTPASRHTCPSCKRHRAFVRYINKETGHELADNVGRCNREDNCGYHYPPMQFFHDFPQARPGNQSSYPDANSLYPMYSNTLPRPYQPPSTVPQLVCHKTLCQFDEGRNHLYTWLASIVGPDIAHTTALAYKLGTTRAKAAVFWQISHDYQVRAGKVMHYNPQTGHRLKHRAPAWVHRLPGILSADAQADFRLQQCFFGEHLLRSNPLKPVCIVESEKTALVAACYLPGKVWLACGGKSNLNAGNKLAHLAPALAGREVTLFPDAAYKDTQHQNGLQKEQHPKGQTPFELWDDTVKQNLHYFGVKATVSDLLERRATPHQRKQGYDLADYMTQWPVNAFLNGEY